MVDLEARSHLLPYRSAKSPERRNELGMESQRWIQRSSHHPP